MSISIERYVAITSGVIGAAVVAQRELVGLRFTTDPRVPIGSQASVDADGVIDLFGAGSPEAIFGGQYFAYISPAPASQAQRLRFAPFAREARPARIYGGKRAFSLTQFSGIDDGALILTLGENTTTVSGLDFTAATTLADVASVIQTAIRAAEAADTQWSGATVSYDAVAAAFNLVSGVAGNSPIVVAAPEAGTNAADLLGWLDTGTILSPGSVAQTPLEALRAAEAVTDSFGSLSFGATLTLPEVLSVGTYVAGLNVKYQFYVPVTLANYNSFYAALQNLASVGLILNAKAGEYKEALPAAIMAATNYNRRNAVVNYMYRQGAYSAPYDVSDDPTADALDANRVNYYGETSSAGQKLAFFQRGYLLGGATAPVDMNVHANEQWLKSALQADFLSLQISIGSIPANNDGRGLILTALAARIADAKLNGTISVGKELTTAQKIAVTQLTGDSDAWQDVQNVGYWADVVIQSRIGESGVTEYVAVYTLAYSKNDVVRKVEGSHNLI